METIVIICVHWIYKNILTLFTVQNSLIKDTNMHLQALLYSSLDKSKLNEKV